MYAILEPVTWEEVKRVKKNAKGESYIERSWRKVPSVIRVRKIGVTEALHSIEVEGDEKQPIKLIGVRECSVECGEYAHRRRLHSFRTMLQRHDIYITMLLPCPSSGPHSWRGVPNQHCGVNSIWFGRA